MQSDKITELKMRWDAMKQKLASLCSVIGPERWELAFKALSTVGAAASDYRQTTLTSDV